MKKTLTLTFGILVAITSACLVGPISYGQGQLADITINKIWTNKKDINAQAGMSYTYTLGDDTARYFHAPAGVTIRATVTFTASSAPPTLKEIINDADPRITYTGTWVRWANQSWTSAFTNKDVIISYTVNNTATMSFTGRKIEVLAELRNNHGVAKIEVKQGTTVIDSKIQDMYLDTTVNGPSVIYSKELPQGTYTIVTSLTSSTAGQDSFVFDGFKVYE